ncbi:homeobox protein GBX-1-like [Rhincodon typus]|uniref:homeobox protein GBX-1-like n=1 Tax=Rhincodon typus TaxID=259920 RepID=UPI00202DC608|nr:homeobox protein GBX-1-like [Rhincodon typus]
MQRPHGHGTAFSIDSLIGSPQARSPQLLYTGYPMLMPYRPLVIPQALPPSPLQSGMPALSPLASFASRLTNSFCASLSQGVPSMVALTTALPSFSEAAENYYPPGQELAAPRSSPEASSRAVEREESRADKAELPHFAHNFPALTGESAKPAENPPQICVNHPQNPRNVRENKNPAELEIRS